MKESAKGQFFEKSKNGFPIVFLKRDLAMAELLFHRFFLLKRQNPSKYTLVSGLGGSETWSQITKNNDVPKLEKRINLNNKI